MTSKVILVLSLIALANAQAPTVFDLGEFKDHCGVIKNYSVTNLKYSWYEADDVCARNNMSFASLVYPGETDYMRSLLDRRIALFDPSLSSTYTENLFVNGQTLGSTKLRADFFWTIAPWINLENETWGPRQPDNLNFNEKCLALTAINEQFGNNQLRYFSFSDVGCEVKNRIICEKNVRYRL